MAIENKTRKGSQYNYRVDLSGLNFGRLTVTKPLSGKIDSNTVYECLCICGETTQIIAKSFVRGLTKSCGCLRNEGNFPTKHGMKLLREYRLWKGMRNRCNNPKATGYENYGGRGIKITPEWDDFVKFYEYMGKAPSDNHMLERINNNGNYEPGNVKWASSKEQNRNKRNNIILTWKGRQMTLPEICEMEGADRHCVDGRIRVGWDLRRALEEPIKSRKKKSA